MNERRLSLAELALLAGTRVALGLGIGLLISRKLNGDQRKAAGIALTIMGGITTIPFIITLARQGRGTISIAA